MGKSQTEALMYAEVWDIPVTTECTKLISYLFYGPFSVILKNNTIKNTEVLFVTHQHVSAWACCSSYYVLVPRGRAPFGQHLAPRIATTDQVQRHSGFECFVDFVNTIHWDQNQWNLKRYLKASFSFTYWNYSCTLSIFLVIFTHMLVDVIVLLTTQKSRWAEKNFIMTGHCKKIMPPRQPIRVYVLPWFPAGTSMSSRL